MALRSYCLLHSRTCTQSALINPARASPALFSKSKNLLAPAIGYRTALSKGILLVRASSDHPPTEQKSPPSSRIFVKGLSRSTSEGYLLKQFSQFGEISKVKIVTSRGSKESLGMAYIVFSCKESAELAIKEMNGKFFDGRFIAVMISLPEAPTKHVKFMPYKF